MWKFPEMPRQCFTTPGPGHIPDMLVPVSWRASALSGGDLQLFQHFLHPR